MRRREFIAGLGSAAAWPVVAAHAQQQLLPIVGFISSRSPYDAVRYGGAFRTGLSETGIIDGQNVRVEYHWLDGQYDRLQSLIADFVRRKVAVIATTHAPAALAAKAATKDIPIVFGASNPVDIGLVASLARPDGNVTGINFVDQEIVSKQLELLHQLVPKAVRIAVLVNPANASLAELRLQALPDVARALGMEIQLLMASTIREIEAAFDALVRERADALFVVQDGFFSSRRAQFVILAVRNRIPTVGPDRAAVEAGMLMQYGANLPDMFRQVGIYTGNILKGAKPGDLPVMQASRFEFLINLQMAKALGVDVPPNLLALADEVFE
jgi:putative tryptophan/tyrosine transport system substrate-binding protein